MKIVIDIPDSDYTAVRCEGLYYIGHDKLAESVTTAFQTAVPLPEIEDTTDVDEVFDLIRLIYKGKSAVPDAIKSSESMPMPQRRICEVIRDENSKSNTLL